MKTKRCIPRLFFHSLFLALLMSCSTAKNTGENGGKITAAPEINCPDDGDCKFEIIKNSSLEFKYDDTGKLYPAIEPGENFVIKYHYERKPEPDLMDSGYSEYVYLEFNPENEQLILKDKELQKVKMIFGRICFCKGSMGYFPVHEGSLFLFHREKNLQLRTTFKVKKVPQIVTHIEENIKY
ncbi:hypothetical protein LCM02_13600 [Lutimonas saemankumensis]|uniref:hypothetical protein n=1 Tax=Lutimonas saemankumensis TaxID=483016 RepID=UPI001CD77A7D|nr:hypothetical protein [Lutimonas saemankumensis]MCA0933493.1 hypothetical protein [Lutimonas saemankumensis]